MNFHLLVASALLALVVAKGIYIFITFRNEIAFCSIVMGSNPGYHFLLLLFHCYHLAVYLHFEYGLHRDQLDLKQYQLDK